MLSEDPLPNDKPGKRVHTAEEQAVNRYKNRLRKVKRTLALIDTPLRISYGVMDGYRRFWLRMINGERAI
uniref:Uncharacterized protein n=1 Tax=Megaselia scalaris TaxID=36166 RepID=T1GB78_MEGSC